MSFGTTSRSFSIRISPLDTAASMAFKAIASSFLIQRMVASGLAPSRGFARTVLGPFANAPLRSRGPQGTVFQTVADAGLPIAQQAFEQHDHRRPIAAKGDLAVRLIDDERSANVGAPCVAAKFNSSCFGAGCCFAGSSSTAGAVASSSSSLFSRPPPSACASSSACRANSIGLTLARRTHSVHTRISSISPTVLPCIAMDLPCNKADMTICRVTLVFWQFTLHFSEKRSLQGKT